LNYVCILQSIEHPEQFYTGLCKDVHARLDSHNAGQSLHTANSNLGASCLFTIFTGPKPRPHSSALSRADRVAPSRPSGCANPNAPEIRPRGA